MRDLENIIEKIKSIRISIDRNYVIIYELVDNFDKIVKVRDKELRICLELAFFLEMYI